MLLSMLQQHEYSSFSEILRAFAPKFVPPEAFSAYSNILRFLRETILKAHVSFSFLIYG